MSGRGDALVRLQNWKSRCDGLFGKKPGCLEPPVFECGCLRCASEEPRERFFACLAHQTEVTEVHLRIRCRKVTFFPYTEPAPS